MSMQLSDNLRRKLESLVDQDAALRRELLDPEVLSDHRRVRQVSRRRAAIVPLVEAYSRILDLEAQCAELREIIHAGEDEELAAIARDELPQIEARISELTQALQRMLVMSDDRTVGSVMIEIRAGVGGDEAALWAGDLLDMYQHYAAERGWKSEFIQASPGEVGGFRQVVLRLEGDGVWAELGYEGGTHQVKRVPATEAQGRVHTSTATVAVLPEPEEVEVDLDANDVREMITTSQGPGGQNVNKVATAVHLIHEPTGIEVRMQDTKSQSQNRERAWALLRARLYDRQKQEADARRAEARRGMIGSAGRSEKIRTYRWKENLVVDHRLDSGSNQFNLGEVMAGRLGPMIESLIERDTADRLAAL